MSKIKMNFQIHLCKWSTSLSDWQARVLVLCHFLKCAHVIAPLWACPLWLICCWWRLLMLACFTMYYSWLNWRIHTFQHQINMSLWYILFLLSNDIWTPINFLYWYVLSFYLLFFLIIYDIYHSTIFIYFFSISISLKMFIGIWMCINHFLFLYSSPAILIRPNKNISRS